MINLFVKDKGFYHNFFSLTIVIALQNIIVFSVSLADNMMLGGYSELSLSGVALANQIQFFLQMVIMGIGEAMMVLIAQYWGKQQMDPIRKIISIGITIGIVVSFLLMLCIWTFPAETLALLTDETAIIEEGVKYLRVICFSYVFFAITNILLSSLRSVETVKIGFIVSLSTFFVNVFLNYVLIYGNFGAPELGSAGAALATLTARILETLIVLFYVTYIDKKIQIVWKGFFRIHKGLLQNYLRVGSPVILCNALWGLAMGIQAAILGRLGASTIAANSIATTIFQIITVICYGAASSSSVIIGKTVGQGLLEKVKEYAKTLQVLFVIIGVTTGITLFISKEFILGIYSISGETKQLASQFIHILSITVIGTSYECSVLTGVVRGGGDTKFVLFNDMIFMWLIVLPISALSAFFFHSPPWIVFFCLKSDQLLKCIVGFFKVNYGKWIRELTI